MSDAPSESASQQPIAADEAAAYPSLTELAQLLPQYEVLAIIGIGGMGAVYKARQIALDRWAAIKVLPAVAAQNPEDVQRFIKEARAMAKLVHPHIVAVFDFGQTYAHHLFLVMEYVEGCDLHHRTRKGEITKERAREVIAQLCDALQFAHDRGVAHRDIKPANILITDDWKVKVADFGLARDLSAQSNPDEVEYGTPDYTAPERLIIGSKVDHRADIYSLGVVIHEMLTGKTPTAAGKEAGKGLPEGFAPVISKCLMSDPEQRYQKASEVKLALLIATSEGQRTTSSKTAAAVKTAPHEVSAAPLQDKSLEEYSTYTPPAFAGLRRYLAPLGWAVACIALVILFASLLFKDKTDPVQAEATPPAVAQTPVLPQSEPEKLPEPVPTPEPIPTPVPQPPLPEPAPAPAPTMAAQPTIPEPSPAPVSPPVVPLPSYTAPEGDAGELMRLIGHTASVYSLNLLSDQRRVVSAGNDGKLRIWDLVEKKQISHLDVGIGQISQCQILPDEKQALVYGALMDKAAIVDLISGTITHTVQFPHEKMTRMVYVPATQSVVAGGASEDARNNLQVWKPGEGSAFQAIADYKGKVYSIVLMPNQNDVLISASQAADTTAEPLTRPHYSLYNPASGELTHLESTKVGYVTRVFGSPGAAKAVTSGSTPKVIKFPDLEAILSLPASPREGPFMLAGALADGDRLAITGWSDCTLRAYEILTGEEVWRQETPEPVTDIALSKDQRWAVFSTRYKDQQKQNVGSFDLLVWRLPKWYTLQSEQSLQSIVEAQIKDLEKNDADLAYLRQQLRERSPLPKLADLDAERQKLNVQYVNALRRDYARVSPIEQQAFKLELELIAQKNPLPPQGVDAALPPGLLKLRSIYRQQLATLQNTHDEAAKTAREEVEKVLRPLQEKREQAGDRLGALRVKAVLGEWEEVPWFLKSKTTSSTSEPSPTTAPSASARVGTTVRHPKKMGIVVALSQ